MALDIIGCRDYILGALWDQMEHRSDHSDWIDRERTAVAVAANEWAQAHGIDKRVTVEDVERVEPMAMGHIDYARKLALYVTELVCDVGRSSNGE